MSPLFFTRHHNILQCNVYVWLTCLPQYSSSTEDSTPITLILWFLLLSTTQCIHWKQFATYSIQSPPLLTYCSCSDWAGYALPLLNASPTKWIGVRSTSSLEDGGTPMTATCIRKSIHWMAGWLSNHICKWSPGVAVIIMMTALPCRVLVSLDEGMSMTVITCIKGYFHWMAGSLLLCHCDNVIQK